MSAVLPSELAFPFWVAVPRETGAMPQAMAITTLEGLSRFARLQSAEGWRKVLISNQLQLAGLVSDLHRQRLTDICVDPNSDGRGGTCYGLIEVLRHLALAHSR